MRPLLDYLKRFNYVFLFLLLEVLAIVMISKNSYYQSSRIVSWANGIAGGWFSSVNSVSSYFGLRKENELLAAENARLHAQMASSYISYSDTVFTIRDTVYKQQYSYTEARVIKSSWNKPDNYLMINKGSAQGIQVDQAVVSPQGVVGVVVSTTRNFATIMPVLHSNSRNSIKVRRGDLVGTLIWEGGDYRTATVVDIPTMYELFENDTIVTSGLANDFPEGILVGYIESAEPSEGSGFYKVKVSLATDFVNLSHVYIVDNRFKAEQDALMRKTEGDSK